MVLTYSHADKTPFLEVIRLVWVTFKRKGEWLVLGVRQMDRLALPDSEGWIEAKVDMGPPQGS